MQWPCYVYLRKLHLLVMTDHSVVFWQLVKLIVFDVLLHSVEGFFVA